MEYLSVGVRVLTGMVFAVSSFSKLRSRSAFDDFARATSLLAPRDVTPATARRWSFAIVVGELAVPCLVVVEPTSAAGLGVAAGLLLAFTAATAVALHRGVHAPCQCFGGSSTPLAVPHLVRSALLLCFAVVGLVAWSRSAASPHPAGVAIAVVAATVAAFLLIRLDDLVHLFEPTVRKGA